MTRHTNLFHLSAAWAGTGLLLTTLNLGLPGMLLAQTEDSDCIFEFNKAYSINDSGLQQLKEGQNFAAQNHYQSAAERYQLAIGLFQQAIDHYNNLPSLAHDCSAANLSIAKNNTHLTLENLNWAKTSLAGLDCMKVVNELEGLNSLSSEYYYKHNDAASAQRTVRDALTLFEQTQKSGSCQGDYLELLIEQQQLLVRTADALQQRGRFDACTGYINSAAQAEQQARQAKANKDPTQTKLKWEEIKKLTKEGLNASVCDGLYLKRLQNLSDFAEQQLKQ